MIRAEEQVLIVYSVKGTPPNLIAEAEKAISDYKLASSLVASVVVKPLVFKVPKAAAPGASLGGELTTQLNNSLGAIVFLDDLRPNVSYELGFFHGQGKAVLLVTNREVEEVWKAISDLAGCALLCLKHDTLSSGVESYLDTIYENVSRAPRYPAPELPLSSRNMLEEISRGARVNISLRDSDFGKSLDISTWGGVIFDVDYGLLPNAKFKMALRARESDSMYSIYFRVRYLDQLGNRKKFQLGLTSNRSKTAFESNERTIPSQPLTKEWRFLSGSFSELFRIGHVFGVQHVEHLELVRVRAGEYWRTIDERVPAYELGYFEIVGIDH